MHVRRGDYAANPSYTARYGLCDPEYYERAARLILERVPGARFFEFSEDRDWAAANLRLPGPTEYVVAAADPDGYGDFRLLRKCRHFITANSSYSWWAAWLGSFEGKIVCAPEPWFADGRDESRMVPDSWLRVEHAYDFTSIMDSRHKLRMVKRNLIAKLWASTNDFA